MPVFVCFSCFVRERACVRAGVRACTDRCRRRIFARASRDAAQNRAVLLLLLLLWRLPVAAVAAQTERERARCRWLLPPPRLYK